MSAVLTRGACAGCVVSFAAISLAWVSAQIVLAAPPSSFVALIGTWAGAGHVRLEDGRGEQIKCKAYYTDRPADQGLVGMGLALKCASGGSKIDLRAQVQTEGSRLTGKWEERQFNAVGSISGVATGNRLSLTLDGGGLKAEVVVTTSGATQSVSITTDAATVRGAQISLAKDAGP